MLKYDFINRVNIKLKKKREKKIILIDILNCFILE